MKNKKMLILFIVLVAIVTTICLVIKNNINKEPSVYYRTYTKENGWSKWVKDGETSGNKNTITAIQIKIKSRVKGDIVYSTLYNSNWDKQCYSNDVSGNKNNYIYGIKMMLTKTLYKKYNIYYRIYDGKNWYDWTTDYSMAMINSSLGIKKIEILIKDKRSDSNEKTNK